MSRRTSKNVRLMEELQEQFDEVKAVLKSYDFDLDECEMDELDCVRTHGEHMFRLYELIKEINEIIRDE
jgi:hypothetical protein